MILVTGAAGKTGQAMIQSLSMRGVAIRALVYRPEQVQIVRALGVQDVIIGDMGDEVVMEKATRGARSVYHICPNFSPNEILIGHIVIAAACTAGVYHFVYHSVLHPQTEAMPHHWQKLRVEEMLFESGLLFTILQPASYMQNILRYWDRVICEGIYTIPYSIGMPLGMVDLEDVAESATTILMEAGHEGATYELCGSEVLSQTEVASILSNQLGQEVSVKVTPLSAWDEDAREAGLEEYRRESLIKMFKYYESYGFSGNPRVLEWLLGRKPTTFENFVARIIKEKK